MESTEPLEPSSSGQATQNVEVNGDEPSTSNGAISIEPREVTFEQFVETCKTELSDESNSPEQIEKQLTSLKEKFSTSPVWKNKALIQILSHFDWSIRVETDFQAKYLLLHDFKEEFKRLDRYLTTLKGKDKKEKVKLMKKVKELQTRIKKDLRKIDRLDQAEVSIDELDSADSPYMKKERYEARVKRSWAKIAMLTGLGKTSFRILDKAFKYSGTAYPALNEAISSKYRAIMQKKYKGRVPSRPVNSTPNIKDIIDIINSVVKDHNLNIPDTEELALRIADDLIHEVQRRRDLELQEMMNDYEHDSHLRPQTLADLDNEDLNKQLNSNEEVSREKIRDIMDTLTAKKEFCLDADIGGDEPLSEDEEEEDPMDPLDDDEEISDDDEEDVDDDADNAEAEDDDDDPVILDEPSIPQVNGDVKISESNEPNDTKKRSVESDPNDDDQSKKVKISESQEEKDSSQTIEDVKTEITEPEIKESVSKETKEGSEEAIDVPKESNIEQHENEIKEEESDKGCKEDIIEPENSMDVPSVENGEKIDSFNNHPKTRSESEDSIKIVDLEAENRSNDEQPAFNDDMMDDDDVICLD